MRRTGERGFTLIEVVLALAILATMLTVLFGGLRVSLRAWARGEERAETLQHSRGLSQLIEQALAGTYTYQGQMDQNSQPQLLFAGAADRMSFVTVSPPMPFSVPIIFTAVTLSVSQGSSPGLTVREKALPNFDPFEEVAPSLVDPSVTAMRFRYLRGADGSWTDTWDVTEEQALPQAVEVTLTATVNGQTQEEPPLTVPIRVTTP
jgi:prepilin-type N-terminal cleavage/methylation domain-containing protein